MMSVRNNENTKWASVSELLRAVFWMVLLLFVQTVGMAQNELYRPDFHFTPQENWINDPNGLVYYDGYYHLFFQYNPFGDQWGNMSWGHARSTDLINWEELPVAIPVQDGVMAFSGSAVVDWDNTSGFGENGEPPLVAIYTGYYTGTQDQRLAYSNDGGLNWAPYSGNPIINLNSNEFRDPKVIWHEASQQWVMVVSLGTNKQIRFYTSSNLKDWTFQQDFGPVGDTSSAWECPELFALPVDDDPNQMKWVLVVSVAPGKSQYFIGDFDGNTFDADPLDEVVIDGEVLEDFEGGNYEGWTASGTAFGSAPANGTLGGQQVVSGYLGNGLVNTFIAGDGPQGRLLSDPFPITSTYINFLIGGGNHINSAYIRLLIDGVEIYRTTGENDEELQWKSWNVGAYQGQIAQIEIVDEVSGGWGHINIDHIIQDDAPILANDNTFEKGRDFYAVQSFSDIPQADGRRIWLSWMSNWTYAGAIPTTPWRGNMSFPRTVALQTINGQIRLVQQPVEEIVNYHGAHYQASNNNFSQIATEVSALTWPRFELQARIEVGDADEIGFKFRQGQGQAIEVTYDVNTEQIKFDRSAVSAPNLGWLFTDEQVAFLPLQNGKLVLRLLVDDCTAELFCDQGQTVFSNLIFPDSTSTGMELYANGGLPTIESLDIWELTRSPIVSTQDITIGNTHQRSSIFPNPAQESTQLKLELKQRQQVTYQLYSLGGQLLRTTTLGVISSGESVHRIELPVHQNSPLLLQVQFENGGQEHHLITNL